MSVQTSALATAVLVCIAANTFIAVADFAKAGFVMKNSAAVHTPAAALPYLAALKLAGAAGLVVGLAAVPWLGVAAGVGLTLFFVGAVVAHIRARVFHNIAFPGLYLLLALASAAYMTDAAIGA
ncbi:DoxX family protein [Streptomyces sp. NBC_01808]|uniref:DoxX family protein n=1 Tax=Streptomyces sp. NBC_01808 TaxID=2975947 RepID=UPI002DDB45F8|nr:DoxX family protein [Streptomyces sp. NBC_01808]WSA38313.1 DoxX family protein [Streptomyces sp. NBC_01808]